MMRQYVRSCTIALFVAVMFVWSAAAQEGVAVSVRSGPTDPGTCTIRGRNVFFNVTSTQLKVCTAANTWSALTIGGITQAAADARYLKLAADNDPLTGQLALATTGLSFPGATSGATSLVASAIAGSTALTLPAATDTLVGRTTADTLANKSIALGSNTVSGTSAQLATAISDETGSGSLVFASAPALTAPTTTTLQTSGNVGIGTAPNGTTGRALDISVSGSQATIAQVSNTDAAGTAAQSVLRVSASTAQTVMRAYGSANTALGFGVTLGGYSALLSDAGNGLIIGTNVSSPVIMGINGTARMSIDTAGRVSVDGFGIAVTTDTTGSFNVAMTDSIRVANTAGGNITYTLPAATTAFSGSRGSCWRFKKTSAANTVTVQRNATPGTDTIDGAASITLTALNEAKDVCALSTSTFGVF